MTATSMQLSYADNPPAGACANTVTPIPGTASAVSANTRVTLTMLLREGGLALLVLFVFCALPSISSGTDMASRLRIVMLGFVIVGVGMLFARTMGGRLFLTLAYSIFFEHNYFEPPRVLFLPLAPSTFLVLLIIWQAKRRTPTTPHSLRLEQSEAAFGPATLDRLALHVVRDDHLHLPGGAEWG